MKPYIGAPEEDVHGRETQDKAIVVVAAEQRARAMGRIRLQRIAHASAENLRAFVEESVTPGTAVITDGWLGYSGLASWLPTYHPKHKTRWRSCPQPPVTRPSARVAFKAVAYGHTPRRCSEILDYYLDELQSADITRVAFLPSDAASRHHHIHTIPKPREKSQIT